MKNLILLFSILSLVCFRSFGQTITMTNVNEAPFTNGVCPQTEYTYTVSVPDDLANCPITWEIESNNGEFQNGDEGNTVKIKWDDSNPNSAELSATFTCSGGSTTTVELTQTIATISQETIDLVSTSHTRAMCDNSAVTISWAHLFIEGSPSVEAQYVVTIPAGWKDQASGTSGPAQIVTDLNVIVIVPTSCATSSSVQVKVQGSINNLCSSNLGTQPVYFTINQTPIPTGITLVGPSAHPSSYASTACNTTPLTFTGTINGTPASGCVQNYTWTFPSGWHYKDPSTGQLLPSPVSTTGNTAQLIPSGTSSSDAGSINVKVNYSCGTSIASSNYAVTWAAPTISGPGLVCSSGTSFTVNNVSSQAYPIAWSSSNTNYLYFNPTTTSSASNTAYSTNNSGYVNIAATTSCGVATAPVTVWAGKPNDISLVSQTGTCYNPVYEYSTVNILGASYSWSINNPNLYMSSYNDDDCTISNISANVGTNHYTLTVTISSSSCTVSYSQAMNYIVETPEECSGNQFKIDAYPNPAISTLAVQITDSVSSAESETLRGSYQLELVNNSSETVYSIQSHNKKIKIPIDGLPDGIYYLHLRYKDVVLRKHIVIGK